LALLRDAERPVIMAGKRALLGARRGRAARARRGAGIPVFLNGLARGCLPADHELFFSARAAPA
jgi:acetolactate synthase-1/2/3 large subunit